MSAEPIPISSPASRINDVERYEAVSALVDGELSNEELDQLLSETGAVWMEEWRAYHLIGDVMRGANAAEPVRSNPAHFAMIITRRLREEDFKVQPRFHNEIGRDSVAANDAVFRWKLMAGLASVAAVVAIAWASVGNALFQEGSASQLALSSPSVDATAPQSVMVQTSQGKVLRDVRLEQLLAEHRQYGGMSAFQSPTGFLRNATYDAGASR